MNLPEYRAEATLRDGTPVVIRAIRPDDRAALREGILHLSDRTVYQRFMRAKRDLTDAELRYFTELDFRDHIGLAVELDATHGGRPIAVGRAVRTMQLPSPPGSHPPGPPSEVGLPQRATAEVAFVVVDEYQNRGAGTLLLEHLARIARELGFQAFEAEVLPDNHKMLAVFAHSGLTMREQRKDGLVHVVMEL